jgi:hypothetical protein
MSECYLDKEDPYKTKFKFIATVNRGFDY